MDLVVRKDMYVKIFNNLINKICKHRLKCLAFHKIIT